MRPIPPALRSEMAADPYYKRCCLCGTMAGKIDFHHNLIYKGSQCDDRETILPLCVPCHDKARHTETKEKLDLIMLRRMSDAQIAKYSKAVNYQQRKKYLTCKYPSL
jgi:hypothetical protein